MGGELPAHWKDRGGEDEIKIEVRVRGGGGLLCKLESRSGQARTIGASVTIAIVSRVVAFASFSHMPIDIKMAARNLGHDGLEGVLIRFRTEEDDLATRLASFLLRVELVTIDADQSAIRRHVRTSFLRLRRCRDLQCPRPQIEEWYKERYGDRLLE